jgi:hypothetical protein
MVYLWRAVDAEGEVLDVLVQSKRNKRAALKLMRKLLKKYAFVPERLVTDDLRSYSAAVRDLGIERRHDVAPRLAAAGEGAIINIASIVGLAPKIGLTVYGATKAFVLFLPRASTSNSDPKASTCRPYSRPSPAPKSGNAPAVT